MLWSTLLSFRWLGLLGPSRGHFHDRRRLSCKEEYLDVKLDWNAPYAADDEGSLALRYFWCGGRNSEPANPEPPRALFVYFGNEAPVELYVENTGLMWESADEFNADLLFIEHRFYGKSTRPGLPLRYLSTSQALDDFAHVIEHVQRQYGRHRALPVIGFGGSYGGMLGTFFKYKYPSLVDGVIAASAPIFTYVDEDYDAYGFARTVTEDALREDPVCAETARRAWAAMLEAPPAVLAEKIRWCDASTLKRREDVRRAVDWLSEAWDMMAMGNYPYESSYLTQGGAMPAWPIRAACRLLSAETSETSETSEASEGGTGNEAASSLIEAMVAAVGVYYNASGTADCYGRESIDGLWDYQYCVGDGFMPMSRNGVTDMFYPSEFSLLDEAARCNATWGVVPDLRRGVVEFGGRELLDHVSNIVFSNGDLDPWKYGGVLPGDIESRPSSSSLSAVLIEDGAHHLDLFWSNPADPPSVVEARAFERRQIARWIDGFWRREDQEEETVREREPTLTPESSWNRLTSRHQTVVQ